MFVEDVMYNGYNIPKNTTVLVNLWYMFLRLFYLNCTDDSLDRAISQNPSIYPDPTEFRPERFLGKEPQLDSREYAFGGGRRYAILFLVQNGEK